jgi:hypothetical protein
MWTPHFNQEQMWHKRPNRRNTEYNLWGGGRNHGNIPKKISENKLKSNRIIVNNFYNIEYKCEPRSNDNLKCGTKI